MYDIESLYRAKSVEDAIQALQENPGAVVICGGSDVLIKIREGKLAGCSLVSIRDLPQLSGVALDGEGTLHIGPANTFAEIAENELIRAHAPWLGEAVDQAGGPQLRNMGTIGGNVCNGAPSADSATSLLTLNAQLELSGPQGKRRVPLADFYAGPGKVHLQPAELLTDILIRREDYEGFGGFYIKYAQRNAMDIATIGCAVAVRLNEGKDKMDQFRIAFGVAAPTPMRCPATEAKLSGAPITRETLEVIGPSVLEELAPRDSWRASKALRVQLIRELSQRATAQAIQRAGGMTL